MAELTAVMVGKATDFAPSITDYVFTYDAETGTMKKSFLPDVVAVVGLLKTLADAKGDMFAASADNVVGRFPVGTDGQVLYVDSTQPFGIKWAAPPSGSGIVAGIMDAKGDLLAASANDTPARLAVGSDGYILYADSTQPLGLRWGTLSITGIASSIFDAKGDLLVATANDTPARKAVGSNGQILAADSIQGDGLLWQGQEGKTSSFTTASAPTPVMADGGRDTNFALTAQAETATFGAPTGTPSDFQKLLIRIKDNGAARTLAWNAAYRAIQTAMPTTTVLGKTHYIGFRYNAADSKYDCMAAIVQA
jgi:hypothetical protein